jgi:hypothetical protein
MVSERDEKARAREGRREREGTNERKSERIGNRRQGGREVGR